MSTTDTPPPAAETGPRVSGEEARDLGRLRRTLRTSPEGRHLGGVAGGLARHLDIDPVIVRVALVVLVFFGGAGLLLYGAGWLFVPEEGSERATISLDERNRALVLYVAGALAVLALLGDTIGRFDFPWPLAIIVLIVLAFLSRRDRFRSPQRPAAYAAPTYAAPAAGPSADPTAATPAPAAGGTSTATYDAPVAGPGETATWTVPPGSPPQGAAPAWVPPRNPRRRGPILFWFTLALIALLEGALGIVDAAGASIAGPAYPALALGVTGAMLVLGAFWGRAGGLILIGLVATAVLAATTAAEEWGVGHNFRDTVLTPTDSSLVESDYDFRSEDFQLDLTGLADPASLAGRTVHIDGRAGRILVRVPAGLAVEARGHISGPGYLQVLDEEGGGFSQTVSDSSEGAGLPLTIDAELRAGSIEIDQE